MDVSAVKFLCAFLMASSKLCSLECRLRILLLLRSSNVFSMDGEVFKFSRGTALYETMCPLLLSLEEQIQLNALTSWPHILLILMIARTHGKISNKAISMKMMYPIISAVVTLLSSGSASVSYLKRVAPLSVHIFCCG